MSAALIALSLAATGCATFKPLDLIPTREIEFRAAPQINGGNLLPVDVIYIAYYEELREVTRYGPDEWFDSPRRQGWTAKKSLSIQGGEAVVIELDHELLARAKMVVVFADYENVTDPAAQQLVIDYAGQKRETVLVEESRLIPSNDALKYMH